MAKVLVVTSGKGGVGKTTSTAALGAALAQAGLKVAVIDFDVGLRNLTVGKAEPITIMRPCQLDQRMVEGDRFRRDDLRHDLVQIAPVDVEVGTAVSLLARLIEIDLVHGRAGVPGAADEALRLDAGSDQLVFDAEAAEHLHRIGAENDAGADARKGRRLFVNRHRKPGALQKTRDRQAAQPRADDGNLCFPIHL